MTSTEVTGFDQLSDEDLEALSTASTQIWENQPTFRLLDPQQAEWHALEGPGRHLLTVAPGVLGTLDVAANQFLPEDPEQLRELLVTALAARYPDGVVVGEATRLLSWPTLVITAEDGGRLDLTLESVPDDEGALHELDLTLDVELEVIGVVERLLAGPPEPDPVVEDEDEGASEADAGDAEPAAEINGDYLGSYYADSEFAFDGRGFVIDWTTWETDQTTGEGLVGAPVEATSDGERFRLYAWFDPAVGIQVVEATPLASEGDADSASEDDSVGDGPAHGITASYLGDYYGDSPIVFDGRSFVVDWTSWDPDQVTDDGLVGSKATGTGDDGEYELYIWFGPDTGAQIVDATALDSGEEEPAEEIDPQSHFDTVLADELRNRWSANNNTLVGSSRDYDVSGCVNGESDSPLDFVSHDGTAFFATVVASTQDDEPQRVRCHLRVQDADNVTVESEENA